MNGYAYLENLSQEELKSLAAQVLYRIRNAEKGIGTELFDAIITVVPQTAIEALVVDNIENPTKILVTYRADRYYLGWQFPGGYIRFGEDFEETVENVVKRELDVKVKRMVDTGIKNSGVDHRGHTIAYVFLVELENRPSKGKWFSCVPKDLLGPHKKILEEALGWKI